MLRAGWDSHNLNAPGKFLISAPGHDRPERARACLLTDQIVTETAAYYERYAKPTRESRPFGPARTIGAGQRPATTAGSLHNANFRIKHYAWQRPELDAESRRAIAAANARPIQDENPADEGRSAEQIRPPTMAEQAL
jgi:hypothetical protein